MIAYCFFINLFVLFYIALFSIRSKFINYAFNLIYLNSAVFLYFPVAGERMARIKF